MNSLSKEEILKFGYFRLARNESFKSNFRVKIGAVLVHGRKPISVGHNIPTKCNPQIKRFDRFKTLHAEIGACIGIEKSLLKGSILYVYRERHDESVAMAKPCIMCETFLRTYGIKKVFYTIDNGFKMMRL